MLFQELLENKMMWYMKHSHATTYNESLNNYYISPVNIKYLGTQFYTDMYNITFGIWYTLVISVDNITFGIWYTLVISSPMFRHLGCFHLFYLMQDKQIFHVYNIYVWL